MESVTVLCSLISFFLFSIKWTSRIYGSKLPTKLRNLPHCKKNHRFVACDVFWQTNLVAWQSNLPTSILRFDTVWFFPIRYTKSQVYQNNLWILLDLEEEIWRVLYKLDGAIRVYDQMIRNFTDRMIGCKASKGRTYAWYYCSCLNLNVFWREWYVFFFVFT